MPPRKAVRCAYSRSSVATVAGRYDPFYFKQRPINALVSCLAEHYVRDRCQTLTNGNRPLVHETNIQDFLLDHGFRRQFCRLNVVYRGWLEAAVRVAFPVRRMLEDLPKARSMKLISGLLAQEEFRRACW